MIRALAPSNPKHKAGTMKIDYVEIKNFCQHKDRTEQLGPGVIGIVGRNGEGKSNFVAAIRRGLTGDSGNVGVQAEDLSWGEEKGHVKVGFSVGTTEGSIKRSLTNASCNMSFGDKKMKTAAEIDHVLYDILGVPPRTLSTMVFVKQGQIEGLLFDDKADRAKAFQTLFGTEQAEKLRKVLGEEIDSLVIASRADIIERTQAQLAQSKLQVESAQSTINLHAVNILSPETEFVHKSTVEAYTTNLNAHAKLSELDKSLKQTEADMARTSEEAQLIAVNTDMYEMLRVEQAPKVALAQQQLNDYGKVELQTRQRTQLEQRIGEAEKILAEPKPAKVISDEDPFALQKRKDALLRECNDTAAQLRIMQGEACPTCKQVVRAAAPAEELAAFKAAYTTKIDELNAANSKLVKLQADINASSAALSAWESRQAYATKQNADAHTQLYALPPDGELLTAAQQAALQDLIRIYNSELVQPLESLRRSYAAADASVRQWADQKASLEARIREVQATVTVSVTVDAYNAARDALAVHATANQLSSQARGQLVVLQAQVVTAEQQIAQYQHEEAHMAQLKDWRARLERARALLHREQLPNLVAQEFIKALNVRLSHYLQLFEVKFLAQIQPDLEVQCTFSGGNLMRAGRLSGGQKVMLGVAFRFAVYDLFVANLGMLILDEPTVYLDDGNIEQVYNLLLKVRSYSKSAGLQLIVVTHEKRLLDIFDKVIEM